MHQRSSFSIINVEAAATAPVVVVVILTLFMQQHNFAQNAGTFFVQLNIAFNVPPPFPLHSGSFH